MKRSTARMWNWKQFQAPYYMKANLSVFSLASKIGILPLDIDPQNLTVTETKSRMKKFCFMSLSTFNLVHGGYAGVTFVLSIVLPGKFRIQDASIHAVLLVANLANIFIANNYFFQKSSLLTVITTHTHKLAREWPLLPISVKSVTKQKFILAVYPAFPVGVVGFGIFCIADPTRMMHLYYLYDQSGIGPVTNVDWIVYFLSSSLFLTYVLTFASGFLCMYLHLVAFEYFSAKIAMELDLIRKDLGKGTMKEVSYINNFIRRLRIHQLVLSQFNHENADPVFYVKQLLLTSSIMGWFASIAFFWQHVVTGIANIFCAVYGTLLYAVNYERAFRVPIDVDELKREIFNTAIQSRVHRSELAIYKRELRSIRNDGIRVGSFTTMERTSTPAFVEFVSTKVASLLLTFRQA